MEIAKSKMSNPATQYSNFVFTAFETHLGEIWMGWEILPGEIDYICFGIETCPETGRTHLQGYCELSKRKTMRPLKKLLGSDGSIHIEKRRGSQEQAIAYCKKEGQFFERGKLKDQGERKDLQNARDRALEVGMSALVMESKEDGMPAYNYQALRYAETVLKYCEKPRDEKPIVVWIWGNAGTGKSTKAREVLNGANIKYFVKNDATQWWCGYDGEKGLILDDFRENWWDMVRMITILDKYECKLQCKNGGRQLRAIQIIITSIKHPKEYYKMNDEPCEQLLDRIDYVIDLSGENIRKKLKDENSKM